MTPAITSFDSVVTAALAVAFLLCVLLGSGKYRLGQMLRYYALQGLCLAGLILSTNSFSGGLVYLSAVTVLAFKALLIPGLLSASAKRANASGRLLAFIPPVSAYFLAGGMLLLAVLASLRLSPIIAHAELSLVVTALAAMLMGAVMLVVRRDFYSQIVGLFTFENGTAILALAMFGRLPLAFELVLFLTLAAEAWLMSILSHRLKELYAVEDSAEIHEYVD